MKRVPLPASMHPIALVTVLLTGCGSSAPNMERIEGAGPSLVPLDSVRLLEDDAFYVGRPFNLAIDDYDGSFYITDVFLNRMVRFDRDGNPRQVYGRAGAGPGELMAAALGFVLNDSTVAVTDARQALIHLFDRQSGAFRDARRFEAIPSFSVPFVRNDTVWMGGYAVPRRTAVAAWDLQADSIWHFGPLPLEYEQSLEGTGAYMGFLPYPVATRWEDVIVSGMSGSDQLFILDRSGRTLDSIHIPVGRRRGFPSETVSRFNSRNDPLTYEEMVEATSTLFAVHGLPDGRLATAHVDMVLLGGDMYNAQAGGKLYVSLLSRDDSAACVDGEVPVRGETIPRVAFRADTLFVLDQWIEGDRVESWVKAFRIIDDECDWTSVRRDGAAHVL